MDQQFSISSPEKPLVMPGPSKTLDLDTSPALPDLSPLLVHFSRAVCLSILMDAAVEERGCAFFL